MSTNNANTQAEKMADCLIKIWKLVIPFSAGWFLMMLGVSLMNHAVDRFAIGFICLLAGLIIIPMPTVIMVWLGGGLREAFNTEFFIETTYSGGYKTTEYDTTANVSNKILVLALAFLLGYVLTPIRMVVGLYAFFKAKRQLGIGRLPFMRDVWLPLIVAVAVFILSAVMAGVIINVANDAYEEEQHTGEYTAEQITAITNEWKTAWTTANLKYAMSHEGNKCSIKVQKTGNRYTFTVSGLPNWDYNTGETAYLPESESKIPFGTYTYEGGTWADDAASLTQEQKTSLQQCTLDSILSAILALNPILKNDNFMQKDGYDLISYKDIDGEEADAHLEVYKDTKLPYRMIGNSAFTGILGVSQIMFENA